jgi:polyhydroxyalkanoate synthesis regulator phasin
MFNPWTAASVAANDITSHSRAYRSSELRASLAKPAVARVASETQTQLQSCDYVSVLKEVSMRLRQLFAAGVAVIVLAATPMAMASANGDAEAALHEIDEIIHDWEDGHLTAEEALEFIDDIIHDLPASARTGVLAEIDHIVHEWEDGDLTAEEALQMIDALVHGHAGHDDDHDDHPAPAAAGNAGLVQSAGSSTLLAGGIVLAALLLIGGARFATARGRI